MYHPDLIAEREAAALARQQVLARVEVVVVVRQLRDVHEARHAARIDFHEKAERGDARHDAVELAADVLLHPRALESLVDVALGRVGATLALRAVAAARSHVGFAVQVRIRLAARDRVAPSINVVTAMTMTNITSAELVKLICCAPTSIIGSSALIWN